MSVNFFRYRMIEDEEGGVLAGRELGRRAGREIQDTLREHEALSLSFDGVRVASPSYLDEIVRAVRAALDDGQDRRWLIVEGLGEADVKEALEMVLERNKMSLAVIAGEEVELLGGAEHLKATLRAARELGEFRVPALAERLELKMPALHQRLQALLEAGAVARRPDPEAKRGRGHIYEAPEVDDIKTLHAQPA